jgi:hypothetical protein
MALKLRPTGLGSGIDKDRPDYTVVTGEWEVGRIYETRGGPDNLRSFWSMTVNGPMTRSNGVTTLEEAKAHSKVLGRLEGVGDVGGGAMTRGGLVVVIFFWLGTAVVSGLLVTAHKHGPNNCTFI